MRRSRIAAVILILAGMAGGSARAAEQTVDFTRQIQPILADNCYMCHGPDAKKREGDLRLDMLDPKLGPFAPRKEVVILVPGKPGESELIRRITSDDPDEHMPPAESKRKLIAQQINLIRKWVEQGAKWEKHWSLVLPVKSELPKVQDEKWCRNSIDRFVLARLEKEKISPSREADKATLIRRVTLDLTGLPPTPKEVEAFAKDSSNDAYEKVVDRLLASPRYGERMVWEWLDIARYADTNGYQGDGTRTMWPWRDWAIAALNSNMPFDEFTIKQIAGDLLPHATTEDKLATGFLRNHPINGEGGRIAEENRVDYVLDQTETVGTTWLGLTVGCARCHDHKFDPIKQKDYYALSAFFNQTPVDGNGGDPQTPPVVEFLTPEQTKRVLELQEAVNAAGEEVAVFEKRIYAPDATNPAATQSVSASTRASVATTQGLPAFTRVQVSTRGIAEFNRARMASTQAQAPESRKRSQSSRAYGFTLKLLAELDKAPKDRSNPADADLARKFRATEPAYADALEKLAKAVEERDKFAHTTTRVMVMRDMPTTRPTYVLTKGAYDKHAEKVDADVPGFLAPLPPGVKHDRLALARWLVDKDNPLTARVVVNRYWQRFFGVGLVKTMEDFGMQGERPVNQELLDWLAVQFRDGDAGHSDGEARNRGGDSGTKTTSWNVKAMQKLIVMSSTYRQDSRMTPESFERDPENRFNARGARFRLPAFVIRDEALAASGLLVEKLGGPGVNPYQPAGMWEEATFGQIKYAQDHGESLYRRSVYTFWRRIIGPPEFFDSAARQTCTVRQTRTNSPLHAFTTMNDPTYVEAARTLAQHVMREKSSPEERIDLAMQRVVSRAPSAEERAVLIEALERLTKEYSADRPAALKLLAVGESKRDETLDPVEHAAYTGACMEILNLDEAITKE
jgi:hypothetical protein